MNAQLKKIALYTLLAIAWTALWTGICQPLTHDLTYTAMSWEFGGTSMATEFKYFVKAIPVGIATASMMALICFRLAPRAVAKIRGW